MNILTPSGYKNIMSCSIGDEVVAYDINDGHIIYNTIESIEEWNSDNDSEFSSSFYLVNDTYTMYKWQSVWADGNVTHVNQLKVGDIIYDDENQDIIITRIIPTLPQTVWYRLEISGDHSYIADGITLHNASRFWVGGTGTWDASSTNNWSATTGGGNGASIPGVADTATYDGNSGTGTVTLNTDVTVVTITIANTTNVMTFDFATNNNSFTLSGTTGFIYSGGTTANRTINFGFNTFTFTGAGTLFNSAAIGGGNDLSNVTMVITNTTNTNLTINHPGGTIGTITFNRGVSTGTNTLGLTSGTIRNLNDFGTAAHTLRFQQTRTWTIGNFNVRGSAGNLVTIDSNGATTTLTKLPLGIINTDYITSGSINGPVNVTPAGTWYVGTNSNPSGSGWITSSMPPRKMGSAGVG
jgi:hypothetical protein